MFNINEYDPEYGSLGSWLAERDRLLYPEPETPDEDAGEAETTDLYIGLDLGRKIDPTVLAINSSR